MKEKLPLTAQVRSAIGKLKEEVKALRLDGKADLAADREEQILHYYRQFGHVLPAARLCITLGFHYGNRGGRARGAGYITSAYVKASEEGSAEGLKIAKQAWDALCALSKNLMKKKEAKEALACYDPLLSYLSKRNARAALAQAHHDVATLLSDSGRTDEALERFSKVLDIRRSLSDAPGAAWTLNNMGYTLTRAGRYDEAEPRLFEALSQAVKGGFSAVEATVSDNIEELAIQLTVLRKHGEAVKVDERLLSLREARLLSPQKERIFMRLAWNSADGGDIDRAVEIFNRLIALEKEERNLFGQGIGWHHKGRALKKAGRIKEALRAYNVSLEIRGEIGHRLGFAQTLVEIASLEPIGKARKILDQAKEMYQSLGHFLPGLRFLSETRVEKEKEGGDEERLKKASQELDRLKAMPPMKEASPLKLVADIERRGKILSEMKDGDPVIVITRNTEGFRFHDRPTGRSLTARLVYRNRKVSFQGFGFMLFGQEVTYAGFNTFLRPGGRMILTKSGQLRVQRDD